MKKIVIKIIIGCLLLVIPSALYLHNLKYKDKSAETTLVKDSKEVSKIFTRAENAEEEKLVKLYIAVMRAAFKIENGGNEFIAIRKDTLQGLNSEKLKEEVLNGFKDLSSNVYWFEDIKDNKSFFIIDENKNGQLVGTINGTLLSVNLIEFKDNEAIIEATSWFGNLGAVLPTYKAVYKNEQWELKNIGTAVS